jgi:hypothetical protein
MFKLKMKKEEINFWSSKYSFQDDDNVIEIGNSAKEIGFYAKEEFRDICEWKSPRNRKRYNKNTEAFYDYMLGIIYKYRPENLIKKYKIQYILINKSYDIYKTFKSYNTLSTVYEDKNYCIFKIIK